MIQEMTAPLRRVFVRRPGKEARRDEVVAIREDFQPAGVSIASELTAPALAESGDTLWLDESTLVVGLGYRTNATGAAQIAVAIPNVDVLTVDLPHHVPDEEFDSMGSNVLALAPRLAVAVDGNPETRRRMERAGVEVLVYQGEELSKGDGGPTCLTRPLLRA